MLVWLVETGTSVIDAQSPPMVGENRQPATNRARMSSTRPHVAHTHFMANAVRQPLRAGRCRCRQTGKALHPTDRAPSGGSQWWIEYDHTLRVARVSICTAVGPVQRRVFAGRDSGRRHAREDSRTSKVRRKGFRQMACEKGFSYEQSSPEGIPADGMREGILARASWRVDAGRGVVRGGWKRHCDAAVVAMAPGRLLFRVLGWVCESRSG